MLSKISPSQGNKDSRLVLMCGSWVIQRCIKSFECMCCENRSETVYGNREEMAIRKMERGRKGRVGKTNMLRVLDRIVWNGLPGYHHHAQGTHTTKFR